MKILNGPVCAEKKSFHQSARLKPSFRQQDFQRRVDQSCQRDFATVQFRTAHCEKNLT
jgi:hypothetical protein